MKLSVAHTFDPRLVPRLAKIPEVHEVYGKLDRDSIGGGRSTYTLKKIGRKQIRHAIRQAHDHALQFNYLINGASLDGLEQTRKGQKKIRRLLDWISESGADEVTVASPLLARIVKDQQ